MLNLESGDRIELFYEDAPASAICATVGRLLTDRDEGMSTEVEDYTACWIEITVDEPSDMDAKQIVLLGTDFQYRLNGRPVTLRKFRRILGHFLILFTVLRWVLEIAAAFSSARKKMRTTPLISEYL